MSLRNVCVTEQRENGWKSTKGLVRSRRLKKKFWSKLRRKTVGKMRYFGFEF